jgi:signal transduction histidine kinase/ligand-binding sensor domain-containing protein
MIRLLIAAVRWLRQGLLLLLAGWVVGGTAASSNGIPAASRYLLRFWQVEDGLPQNAVNAIVQTHDGYIWVGTPSGLARFDGIKFEVFDADNTSNLPSSQISSLFEDQEGTLWIGHETGELSRYRHGRFERVGIQTGWSPPKIWQIGSDLNGDVWALNENALLLRVKDGLRQAPMPGVPQGFCSFEPMAAGGMWIVRNGVLSVFTNGVSTPLPLDRDSPSSSYVQGVCASSDGGLWVASYGWLHKWKNETWETNLGECPWGYGATIRMIELQSGVLAIGTPEHGLYLIQPGGETVCLNHTNGLRSQWVRALCEDREGNLWVGTAASGLAMVRPANFIPLDPPDHWQGRAVLGVTCGTDGTLWAGTDGAGLYRFAAGQWTNWGFNQGVSNPYIWSVAVGVRDAVWMGTWSVGLQVQHEGRFESAPGWPPTLTSVTALVRRGEDDYWVGTAAGLVRYHHQTASLPIADGTNVLADVRAVVEETNGTVWFGMNGGGVGRLEQGRVRQFRKADGLASDFVSCLHLDDQGALWVGTAAGLSRYKNGHWAAITLAQGMPNKVITDIEDDGRGSFWIGSHGGILRVGKQQLNQCADGLTPAARWACYDRNDGLPTQECLGGFQPAGCRAADGWLYFPTSKGLVAVKPDEVRINHRLPPVVVEDLLVDGVVYRLATDGEPGLLEIPPGRHRYEFHYAGLSFTAPEKVRFKHRLEGLDSEWVDAGTERLTTYDYLPPGDYQFRVIASNGDGVWNEEGAEVALRVLPHVWQTWWFRLVALCILVSVAATGAWYGTHRRMRRKLERVEQQRSLERERARIAQDIHDDLGASLTRINLLSQSAHHLEPSAPVARELERIQETVQELTLTMDEIVWAVDPRHDTLDSMADYLGRLGEEQARMARLRCRLDFPLDLPQWPLRSEVRHSLFLAFKEALNNVIKHASASEVRISLAREGQSIVLTIEDNGRGFEPDALAGSGQSGRRQGHGLENMRRRLEELGGRCEIRNAAGQGTTVRFFLNIKL